MYAKHQVYQRFYLPFMIVASLLFAGIPQVVASKRNATSQARKNKKGREKGQFKLDLLIVGVGIVGGGIVLRRYINNKGTGGNGNDPFDTNTSNEEYLPTQPDNKALSKGRTRMEAGYTFIWNEEGTFGAYMCVLDYVWRLYNTTCGTEKGLNIKLGSAIEKNQEQKEKAEIIIEHHNNIAIKGSDINKDIKEKYMVMKVGDLPGVAGEFNKEAEKKKLPITVNKKQFKGPGKAAIAGASFVLTFPDKFENKNLMVDGEKVEAFGYEADHTELAKNIREVAYRGSGSYNTNDNETHCIIEMAIKNEGVRLFLVDGFKDQLEKAMKKINEYAEKNKKLEKNNNKVSNEKTMLTAPKLEGTLETYFEDIFEGAQLLKENKESDGRLVVYQKTFIKLNEEGFKATSISVMTTTKSISVLNPKHYKFDRQFYVILLPENKKRALVIVNVNGTDLMTEVVE